jgi:predicted XRE-type DNA-binding protein
VFADLGFPNAAERQAKLRLASVLNQVLEGRKLSQGDAAKVLGVTQPKVSALRHYKLAGFSVERLMNLLTALDQDVEIVIWRKPRSRKVARISVVAAYDLQTALKPGSHSSRIRNHAATTVTRVAQGGVAPPQPEFSRGYGDSPSPFFFSSNSHLTGACCTIARRPLYAVVRRGRAF